MRTFHSASISEGDHKNGCTCGFCQHKGDIHKRGKDKDQPEKDGEEKEPTAESIVNKMLDEG